MDKDPSSKFEYSIAFINTRCGVGQVAWNTRYADWSPHRTRASGSPRVLGADSSKFTEPYPVSTRIRVLEYAWQVLTPARPWRTRHNTLDTSANPLYDRSFVNVLQFSSICVSDIEDERGYRKDTEDGSAERVKERDTDRV